MADRHPPRREIRTAPSNLTAPSTTLMAEVNWTRATLYVSCVVLK
ncbi:hypothetical protein P7M41_26155 [Vibrio parahaemolyticus]|nr:hypothetical protein [Vibrio parahaemolyticus]